MFVYVIAWSDNGPSKIGIAADPAKRLKALQTGSPHALSLKHVEPVGTAASAVEREVHRALTARRLDGGSEWFDLPPADARIAVRSAAAAADVLIDEEATFDAIHQKSVFRWLDEQAKRRQLKDEDDEDYDDDLPELAPPSPVELIARTVELPKSGRYKFNDYLRTWPEGMWLRWACERMGKKLPEGRSLGPYLEADKFLEDRDAKVGRKIHDRWIEWSASRDLSAYEAETLAQVWDQFVPIHNRLESRGDPEPVHGIHDFVDGVHLMCLEGDRRYKDPQCVLFWHNDFRAVLIPQRPIKFHNINMGLIAKLTPLRDVPVSGFVAPAFPRDIWQRPFLPWLRGAVTRRDAALSAFVNNPTKVYPSTEKRERRDSDSLTFVHIALDCPDEYGYF